MKANPLLVGGVVILIAIIIVSAVLLMPKISSSNTSSTLGAAIEQSSVCQEIVEKMTVLMKENSFEPDSLTVKKCSQVT